MISRDLALTVVIAYLFGLFLIPTLVNTGSFGKLPFPYLLLFVALPILALIGMSVVLIIGKKIKILFQFAKFAMVGFLNTSIDFGILNLLILITGITRGAGIIPLNAISFTLAIINSYFWNRKWVFGESKQGNFVTFVAVTLIGLSINSGIVYAITTYFPPIIVSSPELWANVAKVLATAVSMVWNFTGYKLIVFKR